MKKDEIAHDLKEGVKKGYCRICGEYKKLTSDHIPPKSCGNGKRVNVIINEKKFISQNGFNCRTICERCNNELLGSNYDKEFKDLYDRMESFKKSKLILTENMVIDVDTKKILRCLLGHLLATDVSGRGPIKNILRNKIDNYFLLDQYRKFVVGEIEEIKNIDVYYWYYPFDNIVLIPHFMKDVNFLDDKIPKINGSLIKIFPISLYIIKKENDVRLQHVSRLSFTDTSISLNTNQSLANKLEYFPEHVGTDWGLVLYNPENLINVER